MIKYLIELLDIIKQVLINLVFASSIGIVIDAKIGISIWVILTLFSMLTIIISMLQVWLKSKAKGGSDDE